MSLAEGERTSFLTKEPLCQVINHEISLKRAWSANQDDNHREEGFAIGINLHIGIDGGLRLEPLDVCHYSMSDFTRCLP